MTQVLKEIHNNAQEKKALIQLCFKIYYNWVEIAARVSWEQDMPDKTFIILIEDANHNNELLEKEKQRVLSTG